MPFSDATLLPAEAPLSAAAIAMLIAAFIITPLYLRAAFAMIRAYFRCFVTCRRFHAMLI